MGKKSFGEMFYSIYSNDLPVFVSTDSILHAWHMSYDAMLKELEEKVLSPSLEEILQSMAEKIPTVVREYGNGELESSLKDVDYFLAVARSLLKSSQVNKTQNRSLRQPNDEKSKQSDITDNPVKTYLNQDNRVAETLALVKAEQLQKFKLFGRERRVDFSQFKPRGHYESSSELRKYFRAMMWCGRVDFRIAGKPQQASPRELGAAIIFHDLLKKSGKFELWQQFDEILHTFVGQTDSMTFAQLSAFLEQAKIKSPADINNLSSLKKLQTDILASKFGIQNIRSHNHVSLGEESPQLPRSFTIIGQKFILDSWVMSEVSDVSRIRDRDKSYRYIPTGLDVAFAVLKNNQIVQNIVQRILTINQSQPKLAQNYRHNLAAARNVIDLQDSSTWENNIYTNWLATLRELSTATSDSKYPEAMRTPSWAMKTLNTQLASWTQLRHDTILYAKQSYRTIACEYPAGFVEPRPELWQRFEQMVRLTAEKLKQTPTKFSKLQIRQTEFLEQFAQKLSILNDIAVKELAQKPLTKQETQFLKDIVEIKRGSGNPRYNGWYPSLFYGKRSDAAKWDALVVDVHTSIADKKDIILHQGVGDVDLLMIGVDNGEDRMVFAGPVLSHYEFQVPKIERKSDSEWQKDIEQGNLPPRPNWTKDYLVSPLTAKATAKAQISEDKNNTSSRLTRETAIANDSAVTSEKVKIGQEEEKEQRIKEFLRLNKLGLQQLNKREFNKALNNFEKSLVIARELGNKTIEPGTLSNIGTAYQGLRKYKKALDYYQQALKIAKQSGDKKFEQIILKNIGIAYQGLGTKQLFQTLEYADALKSLQQSLIVFQEIKNRYGEMKTRQALGITYSTLGNRTQAKEEFEKALFIARELKNRTSEGWYLGDLADPFLYQETSLGDVSLSDEEIAQIVIDKAQKSLIIAREVKDNRMEWLALDKLGLAYFFLKDYYQAIEYQKKVLAVASKSQPKDLDGILDAYQDLGGMYNALKDYNQAIKYRKKALNIARKLNSPLFEAGALTGLGVDLFDNGNLVESEKYLFEAINKHELLNSNLGTDDEHKISFFDTQQKTTYHQLQQVLIAQNKTNVALEISERSRARALIELLSSKLNPKKQINIKPPNLEQIKQIAQQKKATFVEYSITGESQLYIWVIKPTGKIIFKQVDTKSLDTPLAKLVKNSRVSIGAGGRAIIDVVAVANPAKQKQNLQKLHEVLIKPIASHLPKNPDERVIFIPHESLFLVPFPALMDGNGKYLIEKHTMMTAPAIQVLELTNKNNAQKVNLNSLQPKDLLVVGNPTMPKIGFPPVQLPPLKGAETEAKAIAKLFNTTALTGNQASKSTVLQKISSARVIHFATHGLLDGKDFGERTPGAIALAPDNFNNSDKSSHLNEGLLKTTEIIDMTLNADLVVLSACDTGRGQITGDGVIGLSRSLITAGASSVIVSLWKIPDDSTSELMTEFYRQWENTGDKAKALRNAMLITMKTNPKPIDWAAFTLIGEAE